jgi:DNA-binding IclR family transcriptional regulator
MSSGEVHMPRQVPAVHRALDILEMLLDRQNISAPEVSGHLSLPRSTVHELLASLAEREYLIPVEGQPSRFRLGPRVFHLGSTFLDRMDMVAEARTAAESVAQASDETVQVAVLDGTDVVYIAKADSAHPVRLVSAVGRRLPAHCTALGKMLLSGLGDDALELHYPRDRPLTGMTPNSITSLARLREQLKQIREQGLASDDCESNDAIRCVAAPVYDHTGSMVAAMSISVPTLRWTPEKGIEWSELVGKGAATLSHRLGAPL